MTARSKARAQAPQPDGLALGDLPERIGYALRRAQIAVFQDFVQTMAELDVRPGHYSVLLLIALNPGASQTALGDALGIKPANLAVMLNALQARGLVRRARDATDRRAHALHLTPPGKALLRALNARVADHERRQVARLGAADKRHLLALLEKLA